MKTWGVRYYHMTTFTMLLVLGEHPALRISPSVSPSALAPPPQE